MKKIIAIAIFVLAFTGISFAQTTPVKKTTTAKTAKTVAPPGPTKKDGTADMRYKTNKEAAKAKPQHLKKDGTVDKRFKENKAKKTS